jgi:hypothetical protein
MKLYQVGTDIDSESFIPWGIFSTREKADSYAEKYWQCYRTELVIKEIEVDELEDKVVLNRTTIHINAANGGMRVFDYTNPVKLLVSRGAEVEFVGFKYQSGTIIVHCLRDEEFALKVANQVYEYYKTLDGSETGFYDYNVDQKLREWGDNYGIKPY